MDASRLTTPAYWESTYAGGSIEPLRTDGFRNLGARKLIEKIEPLIRDGSRVLEIGAGNSSVLTYLAQQHGHRAHFTGLDYSESGCEMLERRARSEGVKVDVLQRDFFDPLVPELGSFDLVYSIGVAEHFSDLAAVLRAKKGLLSQSGSILTVIPNMAGILGALTRRYNRSVYELHVPHTLEQFLQAHTAAGLDVQSSGYICSTNFGILSSCFRGPDDQGWSTYLWLTRMTNALWFLENAIGELPHSRLFSPYIFAVATPSAAMTE